MTLAVALAFSSARLPRALSVCTTHLPMVELELVAHYTLGSFSPIVLAKFFPAHDNIGVAFLNQFGTGVIISTAFVHVRGH